MKKLSYNSIKTGIKTLGGIGAMAFLASTPMNSYSQVQDTTKINTTKTDSIDYNNLNVKQQRMIQLGVNAAISAGETDKHKIYKFGFNKILEGAIKHAEKPQLYTTDPNSFIKFDEDSSAYLLYYSKKNFNEQGEGKDINLTIRELGKVGVCPKEKLGSKESVLPSFWWNPSYGTTYFAKPEDFPKPEEPKEPEQPREGKLEKECCDETTIIDNSITKITNVYGDTTKTTKPTIDEKACSDYRFIPEFAKYIAKPFSFIGGVIQKNLSEKGNLWLGIYGRKNLGTKKSESREDWNITTPLEPEIGLETNSTGFKKTETELSKGLEGGLKFSYVPNNGILDVGLGFGAQETFKRIYNLKKGFDNISQNGKIIEEKPFCVETEEDLSKLNYILMADINANLFKGVSLGLEGRVNDLFRKPNVEAAVKASIELGGCKNRKSLIGGRK